MSPSDIASTSPTTTQPPAGLGVLVESVSRTFTAGPSAPHKDVRVIDSLSLIIEPGAFVAILGPSGCGKSTLLRLIASLDQPTQGRISFTGLESTIPAQANDDLSSRAPIAYVFQDAHLLPWRNVWQNVALPLELMKTPATCRKAIACEALERVGLTDAMDRYPAQLSGGMRMRVSLARAMVTRPRLLLLDEPFAALDAISRQQLDQQLRQLWLDSGITVIFVTHATDEATYLAQRAVVLSARPARIVHDQPIDLPENRPWSIRGLPAFAHATARIYQALEQPAHAHAAGLDSAPEVPQ